MGECGRMGGSGKKQQQQVKGGYMYRDVSNFNTYNYGDALYWDSRYLHESLPFDWYQRYSALRPFLRHYVSTSSRVLMVGCGNAVMSEDMVKDGYENIMNIDISSVAIDMMRKKYQYIPQLKYMQMDVRDMSFFPDESFDSVIDKGTLDSLMITYGDPTVRVSHLNRPRYNWKIILYIIHGLAYAARPGFERPAGSPSTSKSVLEPVPITDNGHLPSGFVLEDPDCHYIYVCKKMQGAAEVGGQVDVV